MSIPKTTDLGNSLKLLYKNSKLNSSTKSSTKIINPHPIALYLT